MSTLHIFLILSLTLTLKSIGSAKISIRFFHKPHGKTQTSWPTQQISQHSFNSEQNGLREFKWLYKRLFVCVRTGIWTQTTKCKVSTAPWGHSCLIGRNVNLSTAEVTHLRSACSHLRWPQPQNVLSTSCWWTQWSRVWLPHPLLTVTLILGPLPAWSQSSSK